MARKKRVAVVGAGFSGLVLSDVLTNSGLFEVDVFDSRYHIGGNSFTYRDSNTGVMIHKYGPHIFNTDRKDVWDYISQYTEMMPFVNRVKAITPNGLFTLPINLLTINQFFKKTMSPKEAQAFVAGLSDASIQDPKNLEEQALKFLGRELYDCFFYGYTKKQWGCEPRVLPADVLKRLPVRFNYDDNYYSTRFQGMPTEGYTPIFEKIINQKRIQVHLNTSVCSEDLNDYEHIFWSGKIDEFFGYRLGELRYRTLRFEESHHDGDYQGNAVINYTDKNVPYTRITEHKHFAPWERHERTSVFHEFSAAAKREDVPFYPLRLAEDKILLERYQSLAKTTNQVTFIGRLGTYRYLNMDQVIGEALDLGWRWVSSL